ncbi:30S ribosome-binding factor RbfA [Methylohalobius crimeensis]|uniref:30S ribosome-binding factor RbfA n=1 Tax=Methylohalobius crimeensis TaxID=244365 RepID=UPI0003B33D42|nr:30S ribosome-binding factor RbfA [Methylohalobius crimeensis]
MTKEYERARRVASQLQRELAVLIRDELKDPRLGWVTVDDVDVSRDLSVAKIYVSTLEESQLEATLEALKSAAPFLRRELGKVLRLRFIPELRFYRDTAIESGLRMTRLLDRIAEQEGRKDSKPTGSEGESDE